MSEALANIRSSMNSKLMEENQHEQHKNKFLKVYKVVARKCLELLLFTI